jgi:hypothetical protein
LFTVEARFHAPWQLSKHFIPDGDWTVLQTLSALKQAEEKVSLVQYELQNTCSRPLKVGFRIIDENRNEIVWEASHNF